MRSKIHSHSRLVFGPMSSMIIRRIISNSFLDSPGSRQEGPSKIFNSAGTDSVWIGPLISAPYAAKRRDRRGASDQPEDRAQTAMHPIDSSPPPGARDGHWPTMRSHCRGDAVADDGRGKV